MRGGANRAGLALGAMAVAVGGVALAQAPAAGVHCTKDGNVSNCRITGEGSFFDVVAQVRALSLRPGSENAAIIEVLTRDRNQLPPPFLYELARRVHVTDPAAASYWFFLSGLRARYDGMRCTDDTALQGFQVVIMELRPQLAPMLEAITQSVSPADTLSAIKQRGEMFTGKASPWWLCSHGIAAMQSALGDKSSPPPPWLKPESDWPAIQADLRQMLDDNIVKQGGGQR